MEGWIKVPRRLLEWEWFNDKQTLQLFLYLSLSANVSDRRWCGIEVKRGQLITSINSICADLKNTKEKQPTTVQSIRTCLDRLERAGAIKREATNKYTVITICNYGAFEDSAASEQQANNKRTTSEQQTNNEQVTYKQQSVNNQSTIKQQQLKKGRKKEGKKEEDISFANANSCETAERNDFDFEIWWNAYGKKRGKEKVLAKWLRLTQTERDECLKATSAYTDSTPDIRFRKDPLTYLNGKCWNDEIIPHNGTNAPSTYAATHGSFNPQPIADDREFRQADIAQRIARRISDANAGTYESEELIRFDG